MKRIGVFVVLALATSLCQAQSTAAPAPQQDAAAPAAPSASDNGIHGAFPVSLVKPLDSKKMKEGDAVVCQTTAALHSKSGLLIPSGSKVIGHLTKSTARSKGDGDASLGMTFDKIELANKKELDMKGTLQAIAPNPSGHTGPDTGVAGGGSLPGRGGETTYAPGTDPNVAGPNSGVHAMDTGGTHVLLTSESKGVLGFKNMTMGSDSVITSTGKEIKLDTGTQMLIHASIDIPVQ